MNYSPGPKTDVRDFKGLPTLFIDGEPSTGLFYMTYRPAGEHFQSFGEAGVKLSSFSCTGDACTYGICGPTWVGENEFDYSQLDERLEIACSAEGTLVMPRIYSGAPTWWMDRYPDECVVYSSPIELCGNSPSVRRVPSFASQRWREASARATEALIEHIESGPWAERVFAYHVAGGSTEEYFQWGSHSSLCADFSDVNRQAFADWLRKRYGTVDALRKAWQDEDANFDRVTVPSRDDRDYTDARFFYDPVKQMRVIDYYSFNAWLMVDAIDSLARVVKAKTGGTKIVGCFFGYVLGGAYWDRLLLESGHLGLGQLLKSDAIDFLTSPSGYGERACGLGSSYFHAPIQSIQRAGKLWLDENDIRTHLTKGGNHECKNAAETAAVQQREAALTLTSGTGQWWFDMGGGWYDDAETMAMIKQLNAISEAGLYGDRRSCAEIAMVVDAESLYYCPPTNTIATCFTEGQTIEMNRVGAPVDRLLLDDALDGGDYKVYLMSGCFALSDVQRQKVHEKLQGPGKTVVWLHGAGYIRNGQGAAENISDLTGFAVEQLSEHQRMLLHIDGGLGPIREDCLMGRHYHVAPLFAVDDDEAETWGYCYATGRVGLAHKRVNGGHSIYCSVGPMESAVLRDIARWAGVHIYLDRSEASYFSRSFIGLHAWRSGGRRLEMPKVEPLYDILTDKEYAAAQFHEVDMTAKSTAVYFRGTKQQWQTLREQSHLV